MPESVPRAPQTPPGEPDAGFEQAERQAANLEIATRTFLRTISHELRTPLNAIIGFSEIISAELYGPLGAPQYKEYAEHVRASGHRLLKLVNQVLEIARLQSRAAELDIRTEPLDHALDDVMAQLRDDLARQSPRVRVEDEGALPAVRADAKGLRTVLFNLLQNAVIHGPREGDIRISARRRGDRIEIDVVNGGPGIAASDVPLVMRPFETGPDTLSRPASGTGLGLPIARLYAEAMAGQLEMRSGVGKPVQVRLTLPAA